MQVKKSPLILEEVFIIASNIISVPETEESTSILNEFEIDVDFDVYSSESDADSRRVVVSVSGNDPENPAPGYCFSIVAQGTFNYAKDAKIRKKDKDILLTHSAIPIVIGQIRSYISTLTALGPFGSYLLPSIDMNHLLEMKKNESQDQTMDKSLPE
jgi:preprotein translocase subunit SecB